ncbi:DUF1800 domain-containing protein [Mesorhizobium shangrilense]|uniref:DUF1800 domain-containing protein n=1 Tax=Mesorhizobium shangrilense TaxID=460060 RepID=A0ABV2D6D4_9HYPH
MATPPNADQAIALNRFGLGARADDTAPADPRQWLLGQMDHYEAAPAAFASADTSAAIASQYREDRADLKADAKDDDADAKAAALKALRQKGQELYRTEVAMRVASALTTPTPFLERLVYFWANHFAVSADKPQVTILAGAFEREAIRPHVLGRFEDMLIAVERHPAMLFFLDQVRSAGPNSKLAERVERNGNKRKIGINENLAREIMELHTLGVRTGYTQADVTQFALALSGWSIGGLNAKTEGDETAGFKFRPPMHEPGPKTIIGKSYPQQGEGQARAVLHDLASSDATALHLATKLARHFIADDPPDEAVAALQAAFISSRGDLPTVYHTLIDLKSAWTPQPVKFKTPWEWTISALRGLGMTDVTDMPVAPMLNQLGQPVWRPRSPAGYDDIAASWAAPDALVRRVEVAQRLTRKLDIDPRQLAPRILPAVSTMTATEVGRAESLHTGLALLIVSPDFQRR